MLDIFGDFIEQFPPEQDSLELCFSPSSHPIRKRWRTHRLSAQFVADYFSNFLPVDEDSLSSSKRIKEAKGAVGYVANELLENAMKFNDEDYHYKVRFGIHFVGESEVTAAIFATNSIKPERVENFQEFIKELLVGDPKDLYIEQLEKSAAADDQSSGLGLLTMLNDYGAKLGWRFETVPEYGPGNLLAEGSVITVTTMAQIQV